MVGKADPTLRYVEFIMGEIVNLRLERKRAARQRDAAKAAENRFAHGRSKAARTLDKARSEQRDRALDAHRIETEDGR